MQRLEGYRQAGSLLVGHVVRGDTIHAPLIGGGVFGVTARRGPHHAVTRLEVLHLAAHRLDLAGTFKTDARSDASNAAVLMPRRDTDIGAIETRSPHADQDFVRFRLRLRQVADF